MLINDDRAVAPDYVLAVVASTNGRSARPVRLREGVYQVGHFGSSNWPTGYEQYPDLADFSPYGVCDDFEQVLDACPVIELGDRKFIVTVTPIVREDQPTTGGWRWHKWGPYIGAQEPKSEYLSDDLHIDKVLVYHVYEKKEK